MNTPERSAIRWRKSSRSGGSGGQCVEVAHLSRARWRKSSRSGGSGGECVEIAGLAAMVAVRDSKNPGGPVLSFGQPAFRAFTRQIRSGRYDVREP